MPGSLFGGDGVVGKIFAEALDDEAFGALVRLRDEIHFVAFVSDVQRARQFFDEDFAGLLGDFDGSFEIVLRHRQVLGSLASRQAGAQPAAAGAPTRIASPSGVFHFTTSGSSRGVSEVWQTQGLERCVFGSVAMIGFMDEFSEVWQIKRLEVWRLEVGAGRHTPAPLCFCKELTRQGLGGGGRQKN